MFICNAYKKNGRYYIRKDFYY